MFSKPEVEQIKTLHNIGLQLGVLRRIYQSYVLIIERILDRQRPLKSQGSTYLNQHNINAEQEQDSFGVATEDMISSTHTFEVPLSSTATVRFERLRDRINLYALSEIQECLDEKESLVFLVSSMDLIKFIFPLTRSLELQFNYLERIPRSRKTDTNYDPLGKGYDSLHACELDDWILFSSNYGPRRSLYL